MEIDRIMATGCGRKAPARSEAEHPLQAIGQRFGWRKARYRGIAKNLHRARVMACPSNLVMLASAGRAAGWGPAAPETALNSR